MVLLDGHIGAPSILSSAGGKSSMPQSEGGVSYLAGLVAYWEAPGDARVMVLENPEAQIES